MRGQSWQYLCDWAVYVLAVLVALWATAFVLWCVVSKAKSKEEWKDATFTRVVGRV